MIFDEKLTEVAEKYLRKGSKIYIEGQIQTRKWQDQSGQDKYTTEVVLNRFRSALTMLDSRRDAEAGAEYGDASAGGEPAGDAPAGGGAPAPAGADLDDDIPF